MGNMVSAKMGHHLCHTRTHTQNINGTYEICLNGMWLYKKLCFKIKIDDKLLFPFAV